MRKQDCLTEELDSLTKLSEAEAPLPTQEDVDSIKAYLDSAGLHPIEDTILSRFGFEQDTIDILADTFLSAYNEDNQFCSSFVYLSTSFAYLDTAYETLLCSLLFVESTSKATVADLEVFPSVFHPSVLPETLKCWLEFPGLDSLIGYQLIGAELNEAVYWPFYYDPIPCDHDTDGIYEIYMEFNPEGLPLPEEGQHLLYIQGHIAVPLTYEFFDTLFYCGAAAVPVSICGDVNDDLTINLSDVICLAKYYFGKPCSINYELSDVDCSGYINLNDVLKIALFIFGKPEKLICCACH